MAKHAKCPKEEDSTRNSLGDLFSSFSQIMKWIIIIFETHQNHMIGTCKRKPINSGFLFCQYYTLPLGVLKLAHADLNISSPSRTYLHWNRSTTLRHNSQELHGARDITCIVMQHTYTHTYIFPFCTQLDIYISLVWQSRHLRSRNSTL